MNLDCILYSGKQMIKIGDLIIKERTAFFAVFLLICWTLLVYWHGYMAGSYNGYMEALTWVKSIF